MPPILYSLGSGTNGSIQVCFGIETGCSIPTGIFFGFRFSILSRSIASARALAVTFGIHSRLCLFEQLLQYD
jgi:hypothetical protein